MPLRQATALMGLSCVSSIDCIAVGVNGPFGGAADVPSSLVPVTARWNGKRWSIMRAPGLGFSLNGVSCVSTGACTAVGGGAYPYESGTAHVEVWNGKRWALDLTNPASMPSVLDSVSCAAPGTCTAVGDFIAGDSVGLAEHEGASR